MKYTIYVTGSLRYDVEADSEEEASEIADNEIDFGDFEIDQWDVEENEEGE